MKALVVYESMYGNTRRVAEAIGAALGGAADVSVVRADDPSAAAVSGVDLLVLGAPTHGWSLPRASTRRGAGGKKGGTAPSLEPGATEAPGVRELLDTLSGGAAAACFDTRRRAPKWLTGRASRVIATSLRQRGFELVAEPESFLVDRRDQLVAGEIEHATVWGSHLRHVMDVHVGRG